MSDEAADLPEKQEGTYTIIEDRIFDSDKAQSLSPWGRIVLFEMTRAFTRRSRIAFLSKGRVEAIQFGPANVKKWMGRTTYHKARHELEQAGFIKCAPTRDAMVWAIQWIWNPESTVPPSKRVPPRNTPTKLDNRAATQHVDVLPHEQQVPPRVRKHAATQHTSNTSTSIPTITGGGGPLSSTLNKLCQTMSALPEEHDLGAAAHDELIAKAKAAEVAQVDRATAFRNEVRTVSNGKVAAVVVRHIAELYQAEPNGCLQKVERAVVEQGATRVIDATAGFLREGRNSAVHSPFGVLLSRIGTIPSPSRQARVTQ